MARTILLVLFISLVSSLSNSQNITPRPTRLDSGDANTISRPTPIRRLDLSMVELSGMRLEIHSNNYAVFSDNTSFDENRRLYVWDGINRKLTDTQEFAIPQSLLMSEDERYIIYVFDESQGNSDINGDGTLSSGVLRMYHLKTGQRVNLGIPARSATPIPTIQSRAQFEYFLNDQSFIFSSSTTSSNTNRETDAPWRIVNMLNLVYAIEGTPTPTPTNTPIPTATSAGTATKTPTPSNTPTATPFPPVPPGFIKPADINSDGIVNQLDLLILKEFWFVPPTPTPRPPDGSDG
jgi:hypothetical protein